MHDTEMRDRLDQIAGLIELGMNCEVRVGTTSGKGAYVQIQCWREDTITKNMGYGFGGKAYPSEHAADSEIIQIIFGLYKSYWEHETRETFILHHPETGEGRRPFGPHINTWALWDVARKVDVRSQRHEDDKA